MLCEDSLCRKLEQCKHDYAVASVWCGNMYSPPPPKRDTSVIDALNNLAQAIRETKQEKMGDFSRGFHRPDAGINTVEGTVSGARAMRLEQKRLAEQEEFEKEKFM